MSYESWRIGYQSSEQAARAAYYEIANLRSELAGAKKSLNATMQLYESASRHRDHLLITQRDWQEALHTLDSERAANALLTAQLAAAEARAERLASAVDIVLRRFTEAETAGYRTADRQFAIDILGKAEGDTP